MFSTILIVGMFVCLRYRIQLFSKNIDKSLNKLDIDNVNHFKRLDTMFIKHSDRMDKIIDRLK